MPTDIVLTGVPEAGSDLNVVVNDRRFDFIVKRQETLEALSMRVADVLNRQHGPEPHAVRAGYASPNTVRLSTPFSDPSWRPQVTAEASAPLVATVQAS